MKIKTFIAVLAAGAFTAGAAFGHSITPERVNQIRPGYTTAADLVQMFGQPLTWSTDINHTTSAHWYDFPGPGWQTYIPVVGSFFGGFDIEIRELSVDVGPDGRVRTFNFYDSAGRVTKQAVTQKVAIDHSK